MESAKHYVRVDRTLERSYPLRRAIKMAKPEPQPHPDGLAMEMLEMGTQWLLKLILLLELIKQVRDAAIEKLKATLLHLSFASTDLQKAAKDLAPAAFAGILREQLPEKPLYH
jgi:hypothetical protein